jgi:hypothetical protein
MFCAVQGGTFAMKENVLIRWVLCAGLWAGVAADVAQAQRTHRAGSYDRDES